MRLPGQQLRKPFYGWAIVAVGAVVAFCSGPGQSYVFSVFLDSIIESTGISRTNISLLYAIGTGVSAIMVATVSRLADRFGPRLMLIVVATALGTACFGMAFAAGSISFFLAFAALRALGQGSLPINATLLTATWFVSRRGRAIAIMGLGFALSNAILPPVSRYLIDGFGWREAYMVLGIMVWVLVIPGAVFIVRDSPEKVGLYPDGADHPPENEPQPVRDASGRDTRKVFSSTTFWMIALPLAAPSLISTGMVFNQTSLFAEQGLSAQLAAGIFVFAAAASAIVSMVAGFAIEKIGPINLFTIGMSLLLTATFMIQIITTPAGAIFYALLMGSAGGTWRIVTGVTWAQLYGRHGLGRIQGSAVMVGITAAALGPLPLSALKDLTGNYSLGLAFFALLAILSMIVIRFAKPQRAGQNVPAVAD